MKRVGRISRKSAYPLLSEALHRFGSLRLPAAGTSMVPTIRPGDAVTIQPVEAEKVATGDILVYANDQAFVVHRVVQAPSNAFGRCLVTRGDRLLKDDAPIPAADLLGRVVCIERGHRLMSLHPVLTRIQQALCSILRRSERATSVFLWASSFWSRILSKGDV